jgi:hypothetical protein
MRTKLLVLVVLLLAGSVSVAAEPASASHNRASQLTWRTTTVTNEARFDVTFVARRSYYGNPEVGETITDPAVEFGDGSSTTPSLTVIAVDPEHDVIHTSAELHHTYAGSGPYTARLRGCCRLGSSPGHVNNPDDNFQVETRVDFATLGSPHSSINPIVDCRPGTVCSFNVVGSDPGGRRLRWRMATPAEATGGSFTQPGPPYAPNAAAISPTTGRYTWDTTGASVRSSGDTFYSTQVIIESVDADGSVVSSAAVDFFIRLTEDAESRVTPQCSDIDGNGSDDNDQDGLCDNWERDGIDADADGDVDLKLYDANRDGTISPIEAADPNVKDIYVEIDHMDGLTPDLAALNGVTRAFAAAPERIRLHYRVDERIPHADDVIFGPCHPDCGDAPTFEELKDEHFGTTGERAAANADAILNAKRFVFHYVEWIDDMAGGDGVSGRAELPGNDVVVSLGRWDVRGGTVDQQAGTFMHELGHNLGLRHGGGDDINCKPNYLSVMSYTRQNTGSYISRRPLDYSRSKLPTLNEGALDERAGVGVLGPSLLLTAHGPGGVRESYAAGPIDWDYMRLGIQSVPVSADVNDLGTSGCSGDGDVLIGFDDWANVDLAFQATADFSDGVHSTLYSQSEEVSYPSLAAISPDTDGDGHLDLNDLCPRVRDPQQTDTDADGVGDACQPTARPDRLVAPTGRSDVDAPGLLGNDLLGDAVIDAGTVTTERGGQAEIRSDGSVRYTAPSGLDGIDTFRYRIADERASSEATVTVDATRSRSGPGGGQPGAPSRPGVPTRPGGASSTGPRALRLTKASARFDARRGRVTLTFRLDAAAQVRVRLERRAGRRWVRAARPRAKNARKGANTIHVPLRPRKGAKYRLVVQARAAGRAPVRLTTAVRLR